MYACMAAAGLASLYRSMHGCVSAVYTAQFATVHAFHACMKPYTQVFRMQQTFTSKLHRLTEALLPSAPTALAAAVTAAAATAAHPPEYAQKLGGKYVVRSPRDEQLQ